MSTAPSATPFTARATTKDPASELKHMRRWLMVGGALSLIGGAVAIVLPHIASVATAIFVGWLLVFAAVLDVVDAFSNRADARRTTLRMLLALLTFAAGLYLLLSPLDGAFTLTVMLVIWFVAIGIARIVIGIEERGTAGSGLLILSGTLSLVLGLMIALELPGSATWAIGLIVGIDMIFSGVQLMALAQALRTPEGAMKVGHG